MSPISETQVRVGRVSEATLVVTLDGPHVRNALGWETWAQLDAALDTSRDAAGVRSVVLTGAGNAFSSGGDVRTRAPKGRGVMAPGARIELVHPVLRRLARFPQLLIAAVEGPAVGVGWALALACDIVIASRSSFFAAPFVQRGLVPDGATAWLLTRSIGRYRALDLLLWGARVSAEEAFAMGLATRVVPDGRALSEALAMASSLAAGPEDAMALTRHLVRTGEALDYDAFLDLERVTATLNLHGPDAAEAQAAFLEKRPPRFGGEDETGPNLRSPGP
jgi:2-(1,2-epoxy-1,2-dihydrophenyl)acetyl-CoA isomerase